MSKITEFYTKAISDESTKTKLTEILGGKAINEADDSQLEKIGSLAKELGFDITIEEAKAYLNNSDGELSDDDLESVAGGTAGSKGNPDLPMRENPIIASPYSGINIPTKSITEGRS